MFVVAGESLIDLVGQPIGDDGAVTFIAHAGGSPYNCAIALGRLGHRTGYLCPISQDSFGDMLLAPLAATAIVPLLAERVRAPTTLAVVTLNHKREARYAFHRGADRAFSRDGLIAALSDDMTLFQFGGFGPTDKDDSAVWLDVARAAAAKGAVISLDPNVRPSLVDDFPAYRARLSSFFDLANIIKMSEEDMEALEPGLPLADHAARLLERPSCRLVIVTLGEKGSLAFNRRAEARAPVWSPPVFGDTVGAGDSLMAGVLSFLAERGDLDPHRLGQLDAAQLRAMLDYGALVAGLNCGRKGCNPPTRSEVAAAQR